MAERSGLYIALEGVVGSGKTTQSFELLKHLEKHPDLKGRVHWTYEPGGNKVADDIRRVVQGTMYGVEMGHLTETYLYAASRAETLWNVVCPILEIGDIALSDRCIISSLVGQGHVRGLGIERVWRINEEAVRGLLPDMVLYFDIPVEVAFERRFDTLGDKFEGLGARFQSEAAEGYELVSKMAPFVERWVSIDAMGTEEEVFTRVLSAIGPIIEQKYGVIIFSNHRI